MIIPWSKFGIKFTEIYKNTKIKEFPKADIHAYLQQKTPVDPNTPFTIHKQTLTLCIDLRKTEDELRKDMNRTTRYQINKAGRDGLRLEYITDPTPHDIAQFTAFYNPFAKEKKIDLCQEEKLTSCMEQGKLLITNVYHKDGHKLGSHVYILINKRAVMFYSCSGRFIHDDIPYIEVGRANRYLHWHDILFLKQEQYDYYDFFGLSIDKKNKAQQNINNFKKGFGGFKVVEYRSYVPQTVRGRLFIFALKFKWRNHLEMMKGNQLPVTRYLTHIEESK